MKKFLKIMLIIIGAISLVFVALIGIGLFVDVEYDDHIENGRYTYVPEEENKDKVNLTLKSSKLRGSMEFRKFLDRYISLIEGEALEIKHIKIGDEILFNKKEIGRLYTKDLRSYPINKRKDEIKRYLNLKLKERIEQLILKVDREWEGRIQSIRNSLEDSKERREKLIEIYNERDKIKDNIKKNSKNDLMIILKDGEKLIQKIYIITFLIMKNCFI